VSTFRRGYDYDISNQFEPWMPVIKTIEMNKVRGVDKNLRFLKVLPNY